MYRVYLFEFLFLDKGVIAERGCKEYGREDFDDKYLAGEWYVKYNPNVMVEFPIKIKNRVTFTRCKANRMKYMHVKNVFIYLLWRT